MSGGEGMTLEFTPTWVVAGVCILIVGISLAIERLLFLAGKQLQKKNQKPLYEALLKVKEELMLLGFMSLLLTVFQDKITKICVKENVTQHLLPCEFSEKPAEATGPHRLLLATGHRGDYCAAKHKVPLVSVEALHHLHTFIFVLATTHVVFSALTVVSGGLKIRQWKAWEDSISKDTLDVDKVIKRASLMSRNMNLSRAAFMVLVKIRVLKRSFLKQFYVSVTKSDYLALRLGFVTRHCRGNPKFNFHKYVTRSLEDDFREVVGISWYLWIFAVIFLLLNVHGWHTYFWIAFIPFIILLAVGTKLEHIITELAQEVAEKHIAIERELVVTPSNDLFWFRRPRIVLFLIHFILFQNAFEIGLFFWLWVQYGFHSCIMGNVRYIVPRLLIGVFIQILCSYSTLPLYAIVTQMGSNFKKAIFDERVQIGLARWVKRVKKKKQMEAATKIPEGLNPIKSPKMGFQLVKLTYLGKKKEVAQEATHSTTSEQRLNEYESKVERK